MSQSLHDPAVREAIRARVAAVRPDAARRWGKMTVDQMLWHCSQGMGQALGTVPSVPFKAVPLPRGLLMFAVFNLPWPKGAPTAPELVAASHYDFEAERARCLAAIDQIAAKSIDSTDWGISPPFGALTGAQWSRLIAKHLDHHLRQFSA